jgi:hypothetical protein
MQSLKVALLFKESVLRTEDCLISSDYNLNAKLSTAACGKFICHASKRGWREA